jgi:two-component system, NtrC family, nitrogen regulation sensor histidine kinase NtrY
MSFRRKLLTVFALTVFLSVAAIATIVSVVTRRAFEKANEERTSALIAQFRRQFTRRGQEVMRRVESVAGSDTFRRMATALSRNPSDLGALLNEAKSLADEQQLDFLEFVDGSGTIISSVQRPAQFGYKDNSLAGLPSLAAQSAFLKREDLSEGMALGLFAVRPANGGDKPLYVIGGRQIDKVFLAGLDVPAGMRAMLYQNLEPIFSAKLLIDSSGSVEHADALSSLIQQVREQGQEATQIVHWSADSADDETVHAIPLTGQDKQLLGLLLLGDSRRTYVELEQHIRSAALLAGGGGILLAILLSGWAAARVTRPVEQLAAAAKGVASGNLETRVEVQSGDELGQLAESFNLMTAELLEQRERLVRSERVAAWRELARRLAHELKNPLFPLQLTVENLIRARQQSPAIFEEIFNESSATLLAEISNLKTIISRFSEFSKMPQPRLCPVQLNEVVEDVAKLFGAQMTAQEKAPISCELSLDQDMQAVAADPELLHRALSNLVLNAMDGMPEGGRLTIRTRQLVNAAMVEVSDTGTGLTPEEIERIFTPYYTTKQHGTGLGLAIVQSVVSDHGGKIDVQSTPGRGTTFRVELPDNLDKLVSLPESGAGTN